MTSQKLFDRPSRLYGRRKGRPISARRSAIVGRRLPELVVDTRLPMPADASSLFASGVGEVRLEIGIGAGEHLVNEAAIASDVGFLGAEPFQEGLAKAVAAIEAHGLLNVRLYADDAAVLLDWLPSGSLARIDLLYPDPWPKRRHRKRRFISPMNLDRMANALCSRGELRVATDIADYADWTLLAVLPRSDFEWTAKDADDWRLPWAGWPGTRYESKALLAGRVPIYLTFRRN
ncbi:MAG: tRNA (guanine(46)-N(7))-methyltransferase TrmB [Alphaproteobacteria bacterium]